MSAPAEKVAPFWLGREGPRSGVSDWFGSINIPHWSKGIVGNPALRDIKKACYEIMLLIIDAYLSINAIGYVVSHKSKGTNQNTAWIVKKTKKSLISLCETGRGFPTMIKGRSSLLTSLWSAPPFVLYAVRITRPCLEKMQCS